MIQAEEIFARGNRFEIFNAQCRTCKTCGYAMLFKTSVVCGVLHITLNHNSLCEYYVTHDERKEELAKIKEKYLADPNSLLNRLKNKQGKQ